MTDRREDIELEPIKRHIISVHEGNKPFRCSICGYKFSQKWVLKKHMVSVHEKLKIVA